MHLLSLKPELVVQSNKAIGGPAALAGKVKSLALEVTMLPLTFLGNLWAPGILMDSGSLAGPE